jgi:DNA-binding MarR family transcriptional regulator
LKRDSPLSINDLADRTATDQSTVSVVVAKLIEKGYVARERDERDARRLNLTLTAKGHLTVRNLPPPIQHRIIEGVEQLPPGRAKSLAASLRDICEILGVSGDPPPMFLMDQESAKRAPSKKTSTRGKQARARTRVRR